MLKDELISKLEGFNFSLHVLVSEANDIGLFENGIRRGVNTGVSLVVLGEPHLGLGVDTEVGKLGLSAHGNLSADVGHLEGLLAQVPFIPVMVRINVFINKVKWRLLAFVNHQRC